MEPGACDRGASAPAAELPGATGLDAGVGGGPVIATAQDWIPFPSGD